MIYENFCVISITCALTQSFAMKFYEKVYFSISFEINFNKKKILPNTNILISKSIFMSPVTASFKVGAIISSLFTIQRPRKTEQQHTMEGEQ